MAARLQWLENPRRTHTSADPHRHHAVLLLPTVHAVHQHGDAHYAGCAAQHNGAERVDLAGVELEVAHHGEGLGGERLVEFDPVQLILGDAGLLEGLGDRGSRRCPAPRDSRRPRFHPTHDLLACRQRLEVVHGLQVQP